MPQLTVEQRVFVVRTYYESHSYAEVQRLFRLQFPDRNPPDKANIWRNVQKYHNNGTSWNMNSKKCGRKRTGRSDDNIDAVQQAVMNNPEGITCRVNGLDIPSATFNRIVRIDLKWHPYRIQRRHQLLAGDYARRREFCEWLLQKKLGLNNGSLAW
jgi:hypothetical protein